MRQSEKSVIVSGVVLLVLAALFTISLFTQIFNFDENANLFGFVLFSAYGYSSFLVPVFLFIAAILLFLPNWNIKKAIYLGSSILPFYTIVVAEKLTKTLLMEETSAIFGIKLFAIIVGCALLIAIEYITIGVALDAVLSIKKPIFQKEDLEFTKIVDLNNFVEKKEESSPKILQKEMSENIEIFENPLEELKDISFGDEEVEVIEILDAETEESINKNFNTMKDTMFEYGECEKVDDEVLSFLQEEMTIEEMQEISSVERETDIEEKKESEDFSDFQENDLNETNEEENFEKDFGLEEQKVDERELDDDEPIKMDFSFPPVDILGEERTIMEEDYDEEKDELTVDFDELYSTEEADFIENPFEPGKRKIASESLSDFEEKKTKKKYKTEVYKVPTDGLLQVYPDNEYWVIDKETEEAAEHLKETLNEFKIEAQVTGIRKGPVITMFEILPAPGVKLSKIVALADNIALRLAASSVRIVAPIPGKRAVGIEVPNAERSIVSFKEIIDRDMNEYKKMAIPVVLGKDIAGGVQLLDLAKTPHLLIAGATGSGKSVCVNSLILSILYKRSPQEVKMILIDPKVVELKLYNDIPHLLTPVITEPKRAFQSLQYCLCEMERRYAMLDKMGVRDINSYNKRIVERRIATEKLPYIVVIIDEFADLMATTGKELESTLARLAAMSRAVGIHLVLATQRPSIDVITGLIKANIPTRIAFMVASKMDSRIIIDQVGAEKLLGRGDMLYASSIDPFPVRIQGTFVSDTEVENVVEYVKQYGEPEYIDEEIFVEDEEGDLVLSLFSNGDDPLYDKALEVVMQAGKASASYIQRRLKVGYNRAARLVEEMEARGIVGPPNGSKPREIIHVI